MSDLDNTLECVDTNLDASLDRLFELLSIDRRNGVATGVDTNHTRVRDHLC